MAFLLLLFVSLSHGGYQFQSSTGAICVYSLSQSEIQYELQWDHQCHISQTLDWLSLVDTSQKWYADKSEC
eukprot:1764272-Amphidinium_carterae.1